MQAPVPGFAGPPGTAHALLSCRPSIDSSFAVVNADDLYPSRAFSLLARHLRVAGGNEHCLVAFPVERTIANDRPVSRALVRRDRHRRLVSIHEGTVTPAGAGLRFAEVDGSGTSRSLRANELVSMNMWGFRPSIFDVLASEVHALLAHGPGREARLPDAIAAFTAAGGVVRVARCDDRCYGITYPDDVATVAAALQ